jgi:hypothetical protein
VYDIKKMSKQLASAPEVQAGLSFTVTACMFAVGRTLAEMGTTDKEVPYAAWPWAVPAEAEAYLIATLTQEEPHRRPWRISHAQLTSPLRYFFFDKIEHGTVRVGGNKLHFTCFDGSQGLLSDLRVSQAGGRRVNRS